MALEHDTQVLAKQILEDLKPELVLPSPYSIWDPSKMKFEVAGVTNPQSLAEMQALLVKKAFTVSDNVGMIAVDHFIKIVFHGVLSCLQIFQESLLPAVPLF